MLLGKLALGGLLLAAAVTDLIRRRIPNRLIAAGLAVLALMAVWLCCHGQQAVFLGCLTAGALAFALHLIPYLLRYMGAGDVKLAFLVGALLGWRAWLDFLGAYCLVMLAASLFLLLAGKKRPLSLPLAPLMAAAYFLHPFFML